MLRIRHIPSLSPCFALSLDGTVEPCAGRSGERGATAAGAGVDRWEHGPFVLYLDRQVTAGVGRRRGVCKPRGVRTGCCASALPELHSLRSVALLRALGEGAAARVKHIRRSVCILLQEDGKNEKVQQCF